MMDQLMDKLKVYITYLKEHKKIARAAAVVLIMIVAVVFFGHNGEKEEIPIQLPEETKNTETSELTPEETENILQNKEFPTGEILETLLQKEIPIQDLKILGSLETIRYEKEDEIGLLALDESHYLGKTDFELEVEVEDFEKGKENFLNFLKQHKIDYKPGKSKIARFSENL